MGHKNIPQGNCVPKVWIALGLFTEHGDHRPELLEWEGSLADPLCPLRILHPVGGLKPGIGRIKSRNNKKKWRTEERRKRTQSYWAASGARCRLSHLAGGSDTLARAPGDKDPTAAPPTTESRAKSEGTACIVSGGHAPALCLLTTPPLIALKQPFIVELLSGLMGISGI